MNFSLSLIYALIFLISTNLKGKNWSPSGGGGRCCIPVCRSLKETFRTELVILICS
jgi:hypothetical protein